MNVGEIHGKKKSPVKSRVPCKIKRFLSFIVPQVLIRQEGCPHAMVGRAGLDCGEQSWGRGAALPSLARGAGLGQVQS